MNPYLLVSEIMSVKLVEVGPGASVSEAAERMREQRVSSVLVTEGPRLLGIVTERDIVAAIAGRRDCATTPVDQIMTGKVVTASPDSDIVYAARVMAERGIRHIPVAREDRVIGIISIRDIVRWGLMALAQGSSSEEAQEVFQVLGAGSGTRRG